ncbi:hypothetical protein METBISCDRAFT_18475 [Metschnikowia bicuspidata]|uniref:leucine--tRNA ligase n=1 Tax=Metschnikowia bicuspidata TaxID=27322 RepID=A0A4P9ZA76_9ASCO|nr:hypothetical protein METBISCDRAFT_18475 [Metschnikowia bicuspidata]
MLRTTGRARFGPLLSLRHVSGPLPLSELYQTVPLNLLDKKWIQRWNEIFPYGSIHSTLEGDSKQENTDKKPFYCLTMFPYPSGNLHLGHQRVYTISDVIARYKRLKGYNVIHPMGWDAFGLPAENAAVERGVDPADWTKQNIEQMKKQFDLMLVDFNWDREINTSSPEYYKWTQKLFTLLFENGLAYRAGAVINWDPVDQTVLANEQVDSEGRSWRSGALVQKRELEQWFIRITKYADSLLKDLQLLDGWPDKVKAMQNNWIGMSTGADIEFPVSASEFPPIKIYTTRPDTLFTVQFLALSLEHPIVVKLAEEDPNLAEFINVNSDAEKGDTLKNGYELKHVRASIPLSVDGTSRNVYDVPVFVAPYVLGSYGHAAVMGCPAHDARDKAFWNEHRPGKPTVPSFGLPNLKDVNAELYTEKGSLYDLRVLPNGLATLGKFQGMNSDEAGDQICAMLSEHKRGGKSTQLRLRDWLISRQRYWGAPIPIIHCDSCGPVPVPDKDLPVLLPKVSTKNFGKGNPLGTIESFVNTTCPSCGSKAKRETDTMDTFIDSSWYFFRFCDPQNTKKIFDHDKASNIMPIDIYTGGVEHAILHLLYSRLITKFLGDINMWDGKEMNNEPVRRLVTQGMVHGKTYTDPDTGRFLKPNEVNLETPNKPIIIESGQTASVSYEKMSKSKYNGVDPAICIGKYGADAVRAHTLFSASISDVLLWNEEQIVGTERWLKKVLKMSLDIVAATKERKTTLAPSDNKSITLNGVSYAIALFNEKELELYNSTEEFTAKISKSIDLELSLNTVVSDYMKMTNLLQSCLKEQLLLEVLLDSYKKLLICMASVVPAVAEECWEYLALGLGKPWSSIFQEKFPESKPVVLSEMKFNIMINGKRVHTTTADADILNLPEELIKQVVLEQLPPNKLIDSTLIVKMIVKKGVISLVCK